MSKLKVLILIQTCPAVPAQWEGWLVDGRAIYIRARHETMAIRVSKSATEDVDAAVDGEVIYSGPEDGEYDFLRIDELSTREEIAAVLDFSLLHVSMSRNWNEESVENSMNRARHFMRGFITQLAPQVPTHHRPESLSPTEREAEKISDILQEMTIRLNGLVDLPVERILKMQCILGLELERRTHHQVVKVVEDYHFKDWQSWMLSLCGSGFEDLDLGRLLLMIYLMSEQQLQKLNSYHSRSAMEQNDG